MPADQLVANAFQSREWVPLPAILSERAGMFVLPPTPAQIVEMDSPSAQADSRAAQAVCALMMLHPPRDRDSRPTTPDVRARLDAMVSELESRAPRASEAAHWAKVLRAYLEAAYPLAQTASLAKRKRDDDDAAQSPDADAAPAATLKRGRIEQAADPAARSQEPGPASSPEVELDLD